MIRNAARALILQDNKILLIKNKNERGIWYVLPGGGQQKFETLHQTLARECVEEAGVRVQIRRVAYIREYIGKNHEWADIQSHFHQVEVIFHCDVVEKLAAPSEPDKVQLEPVWLPLDNLEEITLYPAFVKEHLAQGRFEPPIIYFGDRN